MPKPKFLKQVNNQTRRPKNDSQTKLKRRHQCRICYNCRRTEHFVQDCHGAELYLGKQLKIISKWIIKNYV